MTPIGPTGQLVLYEMPLGLLFVYVRLPVGRSPLLERVQVSGDVEVPTSTRPKLYVVGIPDSVAGTAGTQAPAEHRNPVTQSASAEQGAALHVIAEAQTRLPAHA